MNPFFVIVLLRLYLATATNFTQVFEWNGLDYEWPSEASRAGTLKSQNLYPRYMAVYGPRIFLSLYEYNTNLPVSLVSLSTSDASSAPPKLTPFPSWEMNESGNCDKIERVSGLEIDAVSRLWVLDNGSDNCNAKIWTIDLINNNNRTRLIHRLSFLGWMHDLMIDKTLNETLAYISRFGEKNIVVFSLERNESWKVDTPGIEAFSIALSPKDQEPRQLYLCNRYFNQLLYAISVDALRNGNGTAYPIQIGKLTGTPYRMLMDNQGTMYAAFLWKKYSSSWNFSQPLQEQRFHEVGELDTNWPFTFALDSSGTFWLTAFYYTLNQPRCRLLKAAVGAKPNTSDSTTTEVSIFPSGTVTPKCTCGNFKKGHMGLTEESTNYALISSLAFFLVLSCIINLWLTLRIRKLQNSNEQRNTAAEEMEMPAVPNPVSPEVVHEEIENDLYGVVTAPPSRPRL